MLKNAVGNSAGYKPAVLVFGKSLRMMENLLLKKGTGKNKETELVMEYVLGLMNQLKRCQVLASENLIDSWEKRKL